MSTPLDPHADPTLSPTLRSWVESANDPATDFPPQNLPLCAFLNPETDEAVLGVRIGEMIADLSILSDAGLIEDHAAEGHNHDLCEALAQPNVNLLARMGRPALRVVREKVQAFLLDGPAGGQKARRVREKALVEATDVLFLPISWVGDYTDFYASIHHATTVGSMFRPDNPLLPNYKWVPIGYHGRASSIVPSGINIPRPNGQTKGDDNPAIPPTFGPSTMLDYELEVGCVLAGSSELGVPIPMSNAEEHMLGLILVNDWSARDIQRWEYQPLGPFLSKNFATSIGDSLVTLDALAPFRCPAFSRPAGDPAPLPHLASEANQRAGGFDIHLEVLLRSATMREGNLPFFTVSRSRAFRDMYWTFAQMLTHHTSNGCNIQPGDLIASGTVSGQDADTRGCLLERTWAGRGSDGKPLPRQPLNLPTGETRTFLQDGDEVVIRGWCEREGFRRIGLGICAGLIGDVPDEG